MEVWDAINGRRSIRKFKPDPVDDKTVELVLEAGRRAPSWANTQCWRFIVVRDSQMKAKIADTLFRVPGVFENPAIKAVNTVPVLIVVCAQMGKSGCRPDGEFATEKGDWYLFDTALAVQSMLLAAHSLGLGTVIIGAFDAPRAAEILGVPDGYSLVTLFPLGYPDEDPGPRPRKELAEIVFHDKFGAG